MRTIFILLCLQSITLTADIKIHVYPDTIYVGSLVSIQVIVENLNNKEVTLFQDIDNSSDNFSIIEKILSNNSVKYTLQFWDSGPVILQPIIIDIMKLNQNVRQIRSEKIILDILSNLSNENNGTIDTFEQTLLFDSLPWCTKKFFRNAMKNTIKYTKNLSDFDENQIPIEQTNNHHVYHHYGILVDRRPELTEYLKECNIEALAHWPKGLHEYDHTPNSDQELVNTKTITSQTLSLPCSPFLKASERDYIIDMIHKFYE